MIFFLDLEELLHQLGVGWDGASHPHARKRRSMTGASQKAPRRLQDGCNHENGGITRNWAEVRLRQMFCSENLDEIAAVRGLI